MGFRDEYYPQTVALMITKYGEASPDTAGNRLPITTPVQTIGILGSLSPHLIRSIDEWQARAGVEAQWRGAIAEAFVDEDGIIDVTAGELGDAYAARISWQDYVAGIPKPGVAANRTTLAQSGRYFVPWFNAKIASFAETDLLAFVRQMMYDWQAAVDASAAGIRAQADTNKPMSSMNNATFWAAIRRLTSTMDVVDENPPRDFFERVKSAVSSSLDRSAEYAGEAAAALAQKTGEIAGNFGKGFFAEAGVTSLVVAGIAVYWFIS